MTQVVVVGAGNWGGNLVRTFYELGALAGVVEANDELREQLSRQYPDLPLYADYQEVLVSDIPAVVLATPVPTHFAMTKDALLAGKDVFVEKPLTLSVNEAEELVQLAQEQKRILMVGHLLLYQPAIQKIKEYIEKGAIGQLYSLHQERLKLGRVRKVENVLWSFGVHDLAVLLYLIGTQPVSLAVQGQAVLQSGIEDDVYLHLAFPDEIQAHLHTSWLWPEQRRKLVVNGTKAMLVYDEEAQTVVLHQKTIAEDLSNIDHGSEVIYQGDVKPLTLECQHFLECVQERKKPISDGQNGVAVIRILEEASKLLREKAGQAE